MPLIRRIGNTFFARLLSAFSSETVRDTASGMRVVRRSALRHLYPLPVGLHFTPAMSARAMLSDATRIVEIDMPYAEREGQSKLKVIRDGLRFLGVILENALLYKPGQVLLAGSAVCLAGGGLLMIRPLLYYLQNANRGRLDDLPVSGQLARGPGRAAVLRRKRDKHTDGLDRPARGSESRTSHVFSLAADSLVLGSCGLPGGRGRTRFVLAIRCFGSAALFAVIRGIDRVLDLVEERVQYLWNRA